MCPQFCRCYYLHSSSTTLKILNKIDKLLPSSSSSLRWKHQFHRQPYIVCRKSLTSHTNWHITRIIVYLLSNIFILLSFFNLVVANDELQIPPSSSSLSSNDSTTTITTELPPTQNYTIRNLEPYTEYFVTLRVFNPKGDGPVATLAATTDEGGMQFLFRSNFLK